MGIYSLQHSSQQAEEALSQGLEQLQQSLIDTLAASPVIDGMQQMAVALGKISNLEGFIRQVPISLALFLFHLLINFTYITNCYVYFWRMNHLLHFINTKEEKRFSFHTYVSSFKTMFDKCYNLLS